MPGPNEVVDSKIVDGVPEGMPVDSGVSSKEEMPATGSGDANVEALKAKYEADLRKLQSALQSGHQREIAALKQRLDEAEKAAVAKMDEKEKAEFERQKILQENQELKQRMAQEQERREQQAVMDSWVGFFTDKGIDAATLDTTDPQLLIQTGMSAMSELIDSLKGNGGAKTDAKVSAKRPAAPPVVTGSGRSPSTRRTIIDAVDAVSKITGKKLTEADLYEMHERGEINLNDHIDLE